jgi:hypothetical protein
MKTAISIPDTVFKRADRVAHSMGMSRSELDTRAVESFVDLHDVAKARRALDELYSEESSELDPVLAALQAESLSKVEW